MPGTTAFPSALDTFPDISANTPENETGKEHDVVHNNEMAALLALQIKVGINGSSDPASLDYRVAALEAGVGGGVSVAIQFVAELANTTDSDPGAGLLKWNHATQASATEIYLDDLTFDGVSLTALWPALVEGGFLYLQHATDPDTWQIWVIDTVTDATGYAKLAVTLAADGGSFADGDAMLVTLQNGASASAGDVVGPASAVSDRLALFDGTSGKQLKDGGKTIADLRAPAIQSVTSAATVTPTFADDLVKVTAQAVGLTLANPTGTAIPGLGMVIRIKDNGTARSIAYGSQYRAIGLTLPTATVIGKTLYLAMIYNSDDTKWDVVAVGQEA
jgi:hypothetical protein